MVAKDIKGNELKVGDRVRFVDPSSSCFNGEVGTIVTVEGLYESFGELYITVDAGNYSPIAFEKVEERPTQFTVEYEVMEPRKVTETVGSPIQLIKKIRELTARGLKVSVTAL